MVRHAAATVSRFVRSPSHFVRVKQTMRLGRRTAGEKRAWWIAGRCPWPSRFTCIRCFDSLGWLMAWTPATTRVHEASSVAPSWPLTFVLVLLSSDNLQTILPFFDTHSLVPLLHSLTVPAPAWYHVHSPSLSLPSIYPSTLTGTSPVLRVLARLGSNV
jgi:hypothetical protein